MLSIRVSKKAKTDLDEIFNLILLDKPMVAKEYIAKLLEYMQLLKLNPEMGIDCKQKGFNRDCRVLYYGNYTILYRVAISHISIQRVINTKQNYKGKN